MVFQGHCFSNYLSLYLLGVQFILINLLTHIEYHIYGQGVYVLWKEMERQTVEIFLTGFRLEL